MVKSWPRLASTLYLCCLMIIALVSSLNANDRIETDISNTNINSATQKQNSAAEDLFAISWQDKIIVFTLDGEFASLFSNSLVDKLRKTIQKADQDKAFCVVIEVDSLGGYLGIAEELSETIFSAKSPTTALVLKNAISGGAIVALACDELYMLPGSSLGDIQPMAAAGLTIDQRQIEKVETFTRSIVERITENRPDFPTNLVRAMVTSSIELYEVVLSDNSQHFLTAKELATLEENISAQRDERTIAKRTLISESGHLLTLTTKKATQYNIAKTAENSEDFYKKISTTTDNITREIIRIDAEISNSSLDNLLEGWPIGLQLLLAAFLIIAIVAAITEAYMPGFGIPGAISIIGFVGFFSILYLTGRAEPFEIVLFIIGVALLVVEIVVLPGFGVTGIAGLLCIMAAVLLSYLPPWEMMEQPGMFSSYLLQFILLIVITISASIIVIYLLFKYGKHIPILRNFYLDAELEADKNKELEPTKLDDDPLKKYLGQTGTVTIRLRPAGKVRLDDGQIVDVVSDGLILPEGTRVQVIDVSMNRIMVTSDNSAR